MSGIVSNCFPLYLMVFNYVSIIGEIVRVGETRWKSLCLQNEMRSFGLPHDEKQDPMPARAKSP